MSKIASIIADKLKHTLTINGTTFDGSADKSITISTSSSGSSSSSSSGSYVPFTDTVYKSELDLNTLTDTGLTTFHYGTCITNSPSGSSKVSAANAAVLNLFSGYGGIQLFFNSTSIYKRSYRVNGGVFGDWEEV